MKNVTYRNGRCACSSFCPCSLSGCWRWVGSSMPCKTNWTNSTTPLSPVSDYTPQLHFSLFDIFNIPLPFFSLIIRRSRKLVYKCFVLAYRLPNDGILWKPLLGLSFKQSRLCFYVILLKWRVSIAIIFLLLNLNLGIKLKNALDNEACKMTRYYVLSTFVVSNHLDYYH